MKYAVFRKLAFTNQKCLTGQNSFVLLFSVRIIMLVNYQLADVTKSFSSTKYLGIFTSTEVTYISNVVFHISLFLTLTCRQWELHKLLLSLQGRLWLSSRGGLQPGTGAGLDWTIIYCCTILLTVTIMLPWYSVFNMLLLCIFALCIVTQLLIILVSLYCY